MDYITRQQASKDYWISLVTLDKYLKLWRIRRRKRKGQILIDRMHLKEYMELSNQMWWVFENKGLFEELEQNWTTTEKEENPQNTTNTDLAIIGGYQNLIANKDLVIEEKNNTILDKEKQIRYWSNWFFAVLVLFVCCVLFVLFLLSQ